MSALVTDAPLFFQAHIFFCTNHRAPDYPKGDCGRHNSEALARYLKTRVKECGLSRVRVNTTGCLHRCSLGPVLVIYPEGVWYSFKDEADIDLILDRHLLKGERVDSLMLPNTPIAQAKTCSARPHTDPSHTDPSLEGTGDTWT